MRPGVPGILGNGVPGTDIKTFIPGVPGAANKCAGVEGTRMPCMGVWGTRQGIGVIGAPIIGV